MATKKQSVPDRGPFYIRTAEESDKHLKELKRQALLTRLSEASNARALEKRAARRKENASSEEKVESFASTEIKPIKKTFGTSYKEYRMAEGEAALERGVNEFEWSTFMDQVEDSYDLGSTTPNYIQATSLNSPIDTATGENIADFSNSWFEEDDPYSTMFKDEIAMTSEILKDLKSSGKMAMEKLKTLGGRGSGGVTKTYSDLLTAITSIQTSKLSAIDKIAGWKLKREELRLKAKKDMPETDNDIDSIVDNYYAKYVVGGVSYDQSHTELQQNPPEPDNMQYNNDYQEDQSRQPNNNTQSGPRKFNLTDPDMYDDEPYDTSTDQNSSDPYGYIRHANDDVEICVEQLPSGNLSFVAIDKNGDYLDDYEVPGKMMLDSLNISPISKYATDKAGRRYRIINFETQLDIN